MGLFSLAGEIKKEGFNVEIIHLGIEKYLDKNFSLASYVKENNINLLPFLFTGIRRALMSLNLQKF